jgi:hypothetical protein
MDDQPSRGHSKQSWVCGRNRGSTPSSATGGPLRLRQCGDSPSAGRTGRHPASSFDADHALMCDISCLSARRRSRAVSRRDCPVRGAGGAVLPPAPYVAIYSPPNVRSKPEFCDIARARHSSTTKMPRIFIGPRWASAFVQRLPTTAPAQRANGEFYLSISERRHPNST